MISSPSVSKVTGSELSQQLGRQAVQNLIKNSSSKPNSTGISVKSIYSESRIGNNLSQGLGQQLSKQQLLAAQISPSKLQSNVQFLPHDQLSTPSQQFDQMAQLTALQAQVIKPVECKIKQKLLQIPCTFDLIFGNEGHGWKWETIAYKNIRIQEIKINFSCYITY